jgi:hypothetical protein
VDAHGQTSPGYHTGMFWANLGSAGGLIWSAIAHPSYDLGAVPPILIAAGSLIAAFWSGRKIAEDIRHSRELHQLENEAKKIALVFEVERNRMLLSQLPPIGSKEFREQFLSPPSINTAPPGDDPPGGPHDVPVPPP